MNIRRIFGSQDALRKYLKTENDPVDGTNEEKEVSAMVATLRQGGRVDIKTKFLRFAKINSKSAGNNLQSVVYNSFHQKRAKKGQLKFRTNGVEIELKDGQIFFLNLGEISGCVIDEGTNLFALCLNDYEDEYHDDLLVMFAKTTSLARVATRLTRHLLTTRDEKLQEVTSPTDGRKNLPNVNRRWRQRVKELKPKPDWFVGRLADCPDQFCRQPVESEKHEGKESIMAFDDITVDERQGLNMDLIGIPAIIKCARQRDSLKKALR